MIRPSESFLGRRTRATIFYQFFWHLRSKYARIASTFLLRRNRPGSNSISRPLRQRGAPICRDRGDSPGRQSVWLERQPVFGSAEAPAECGEEQLLRDGSHAHERYTEGPDWTAR